MVFHLAWWLVAGFNTVDGLAGGTLKAAVFVAVVVHGHQALQVVLMSTLRQATDRLCPRNATDTWAFIARWATERLHTDSAILRKIRIDRKKENN